MDEKFAVTNDTNEAGAKIIQKQLIVSDFKFERSFDEIDQGNMSFEFGKMNRKTGDSLVVGLKCWVEQENVFEFTITLLGIYEINNEVEDGSDRTDIVEYESNILAIMFPYLRSQVTLLTSQPGMQPISLPVFNINKLFGDK